MKKRYTSTALVVSAFMLCVLPGQARGNDSKIPARKSAPQGASRSVASEPVARELELGQDLLDNKRKQDWGKGLLGAGLGLIIAGVALVEVDPWGDVGLAGFCTIGAGNGVLITGMFLMGFSHPVHLKKRSSSALSAAPLPGGAGVVYAGHF